MYHTPIKLNKSLLDMTCSYLLHVGICHHCSWYCVSTFCLVTLIRLVRYLTSSLARMFNEDAINGICPVPCLSQHLTENMIKSD